MAKLTKQERARLPAKDFAGPGRSFPIENKAHARAAILRSGNAPPSERARIKSKAEAVLRGGKKKEK